MSEPPIRVLVVDDDEEDYMLTRGLLQGGDGAKFELSWAPTYDAALDQLQTPYNVCLVDYRLGAQSGLAFIGQAIAEGFSGPLILLTGHGSHELDVEAMKAGASDYLVKGETTRQLMERAIRHSLDRNVAGRALVQSEEQLRQGQKMEAIGRLAGGVAHDFNNLLSVILGYSEMLTENLKPDDPKKEDLDAIHQAGVRAAGLTVQLLAFSRKQALTRSFVNLNDVLAGMETMLRRLISEDVEFTTAPALELPEILVDTGQLEQVIMNLALNARDAMLTGGQLIITTAEVVLDEAYASEHPGSKAGAHVLLAVSDTGCGMDKLTQAQMFEAFFTTKDSKRGTGLGLATVWGIVQGSGGSIRVSSELNKGTTFNLYFPVAEQQSTLSVQQPPVEQSLLLGSETILIVEDELSVRVLARTILLKHGYAVLEAQSAAHAELICEQHPGSIDLLLTDVVMPGMGGRQLTERLQLLRQEMKVLYMSGYTDDTVAQHGIMTSNVAFIQKPLMPDALAQEVRSVLDATPRLVN